MSACSFQRSPRWKLTCRVLRFLRDHLVAVAASMKIESVPRIAGALRFMPEPHRDDRGFFCRTFDVDVVRAAESTHIASPRTACRGPREVW